MVAPNSKESTGRGSLLPIEFFPELGDANLRICFESVASADFQAGNLRSLAQGIQTWAHLHEARSSLDQAT